MARHRDVRAMKYSDEYDGFDDVYGHSVEDDYCVSPSAEQFMFDRNKQQNMASFFTEPDIKEDNEDEDQASAPSKELELSEVDSVKLVSCIEAIRKIIGNSVTRAELTEKIIKGDFNVEVVLDEILNTTQQIEHPAATVTEGPDSQTGIKGIKPLLPSPCTMRVVPATTKTVIKGFNVTTENNKCLSPRTESSRSHSPVSQPNSPRPQHKENLRKLEVSPAPTTIYESPSGYGRLTPDIEIRGKTAEPKRNVAEIYKECRGDSKAQLHLVVVGHVDAGKSTLLGRLLYDLGHVSSKLIHRYQQESKKVGKQSFAYAWVLDETGEERERGITMDIGYSKFDTERKSVTLLDAPGHKDFIPNMITGVTQADVALLIVDATTGEFETGFESGGQTREHALLLRSLGISQVAVVVNKLDTVDWSEERFTEIVTKMSLFLKQAGYKQKLIFVPCSGLSGENITVPPKTEKLSEWYTGPTLLSVIDNFECPERPVNESFRCSVDDICKRAGSNLCISGQVKTGMIAVGDKVLVSPHNEIAVVKGMQIDEVPATTAFAGDHIFLTLTGIDQQNVTVGDVICTPSRPIPTTTCFEVHVVIFTVEIPITKGATVVLHIQSLVQPAIITKLIAQLHKSTGEVMKKKPRSLPKNSSAIIEIKTSQPICLELYKDVKQLGRVMLRVAGTTIAAGLVTKIK